MIVILFASSAAPAGAATTSFDDPAGDESSIVESGAAQPRADILRVAVEATETRLELRVTVSETVPLDSPDWEGLALVATLGGTDGFDDYEHVAVIAQDEEGRLRVVLGPLTGHACDGTARVDGSAYVLVFRSCVRVLPRVLAVGVQLLAFGDEDFHIDVAPDEGLSEPLTAFTGPPADVRLAGTDRIATALAVSADVFGGSDAGGVVLAASHAFPDALAGAALARAVDGPLLLTPTAGLDGRVRAELDRVLEPGETVYLLGGTAALAPAVVDAVQAAGYAAERVAGVDRFETAIAPAEEVDHHLDEFDGGGGHEVVLIADGRTFTDALIAGAAAPAQRGVVVLTDGRTLPPVTRGYLSADPTEHVAIGATAAAAAPAARAVTAPSASELSRRVADQLLPTGGVVALASQADFPDALGGGAHAAALGAVLLLTDPHELSAPAAAALADRKTSMRQLVVYGGTAAVSEQVVDQARHAVD